MAKAFGGRRGGVKRVTIRDLIVSRLYRTHGFVHLCRRCM